MEFLDVRDELFVPIVSKNIRTWQRGSVNRHNLHTPLNCALASCNRLLDIPLNELFREIKTIRTKHVIPEIVAIFIKDEVTMPNLYRNNKKLWNEIVYMYGLHRVLNKLMPYLRLLKTIMIQVRSMFLDEVIREMEKMKNIRMLLYSCYCGNLKALPFQMIISDVSRFL
jgi:hypothetical protein